MKKKKTPVAHSSYHIPNHHDTLLYRSLKAQIRYHKYLYHEFNKNEITDYEYDVLEKRFNDLAEKYGVEGSWVGYNPDK